MSTTSTQLPPVPLRERINVRLIVFIAVISGFPLLMAYLGLRSMMSGGITQHGTYAEVDLKALGFFPFDQNNGVINDIPPRWRALDGKRVVFEGFMYAPDAAGREIDHFQFVYNLTKCCFSGPPLVQERVFAAVPEGARPVNYYYGDLVRLTGTLHVNVLREEGAVRNVYTLDVEKVERV